jgi:voltage-gated potassium channel
VLTVLLKIVQSIDQDYRATLRITEWIFAVLFPAEYIARLVTAPCPGRYAGSFFGIVDFLASDLSTLAFFLGLPGRSVRTTD